MFDELLNCEKHPLLGFSHLTLSTSAIMWICDVFQNVFAKRDKEHWEQW